MHFVLFLRLLFRLEPETEVLLSLLLLLLLFVGRGAGGGGEELGYFVISTSTYSDLWNERPICFYIGCFFRRSARGDFVSFHGQERETGVFMF